MFIDAENLERLSDSTDGSFEHYNEVRDAAQADCSWSFFHDAGFFSVGVYQFDGHESCFLMADAPTERFFLVENAEMIDLEALKELMASVETEENRNLVALQTLILIVRNSQLRAISNKVLKGFIS